MFNRKFLTIPVIVLAVLFVCKSVDLFDLRDAALMPSFAIPEKVIGLIWLILLILMGYVYSKFSIRAQTHLVGDHILYFIIWTLTYPFIFMGIFNNPYAKGLSVIFSLWYITYIRLKIRKYSMGKYEWIFWLPFVWHIYNLLVIVVQIYMIHHMTALQKFFYNLF